MTVKTHSQESVWRRNCSFHLKHSHHIHTNTGNEVLTLLGLKSDIMHISAFTLVQMLQD